MRWPAPLVAALSLVATLVGSSGCKENGLDYYDEGLRLLGEAERGDCKPGFDRATGQAVINTTRISTCLEKTRAALEQLHKARELGVDTREANELIAKTEAEVAELESRMRTVSRMEREL